MERFTLARILYGWELGGGAGHLGPLRPIARVLQAAGHELVVVVREPARAVATFRDTNVRILQSPLIRSGVPLAYERPTSYPQILQNIGFGEADKCEAIVRCWDNIVQLVDPDLVVADHAPGMLLACLDTDLPVSAIGTGFTIPPRVAPMPSLVVNPIAVEPGTNPQRAQEMESEESLLANIQTVMRQLGRTTVLRLCDIFPPPSRTFLTTSASLDHYRGRIDAQYYGAIQADAAVGDIDWPPGTGPKIFCYLKQSMALGHLFDYLRNTDFPTVIVCDAMNAQSLQQLASVNLRFTDQFLPIDRIVDECDLAILNGTHGMSSAMVSGGKPILQAPHNLEQLVTANRTLELGIGLVADCKDGPALVNAFQAMVTDDRFAQNARKLARNDWLNQSKTTAAAIADHLLQLMGSASS